MFPSEFLVVLFLAILIFAAESQEINEDASSRNETAKEATNWAILIAGSRDYWNFRHQADVCHAYQVLKAGGLKEENIVVFMYDDIANNEENLFPGVIINRPGGQNVYPGVPKDYTGENASSKNFFAVLQGNRSALTGGSGKVVDSGPNDNIFIFYSDHGAPGILDMPDDEADLIYANELVDALKAKHAAHSYKSMVIYIEACEAGSMFDGILPNDLNIYAVTASNKTEDSYATYCSYHHGPCLGDMFSVSWMEDSDQSSRLKETLQQQYEMARYRTQKNAEKISHVMQYGDLRLKDKLLSNYQGINHKNTTVINDSISSTSSVALSQYDADLFYFMHKVQRVPKASQENFKAYKELYHEISCRSYLDQNINQIVRILFNDEEVTKVMETTRPQGKAIVDDWDRFKKLINTYNQNCGSLSSYGLKYVKVIANMCNFGIQVDQMARASKEVCQRQPLNLCKTL